MFAHQLAQLGQWMGANDLLDAGVQERLERLEQQVRSDKVTVAFVGEFSRGKSELINAIFFCRLRAAHHAGERRAHHHVSHRAGL